MRFRVQGVVPDKIWIRFATPVELREDHKWWRKLEFIPRAIVHENGLRALPDDMVGIQICLLREKAMLSSERERGERETER